MKRVAFQLKVREDVIDDYRRAHEAVWPEMLDALRRHGWHNYSLFMLPDGTLFGYFESPLSFEAALAGMATEEVNERWQSVMQPFFEGVGAHADEMMVDLVEVFHLD
jgi:L-rhamnose mutarotase